MATRKTAQIGDMAVLLMRVCHEILKEMLQDGNSGVGLCQACSSIIWDAIRRSVLHAAYNNPKPCHHFVGPLGSFNASSGLKSDSAEICEDNVGALEGVRHSLLSIGLALYNINQQLICVCHDFLKISTFCLRHGKLAVRRTWVVDAYPNAFYFDSVLLAVLAHLIYG